MTTIKTKMVEMPAKSVLYRIIVLAFHDPRTGAKHRHAWRARDNYLVNLKALKVGIFQ